MRFPEFESFDGLGLAGLVRKGEVTPSELLEAAIERVEIRNPKINAVVMQLYDFGRQTIAAGLPEGPFRGVPFLLKDLNGSLGGFPTTRGSHFFADVVPPEDGVLVKRYKQAGLVIFGKTNTCELGLSVTCEPQFYGPTRNPWNLEHTPGGSSGGSSAAVAARMVPMAHAADGFGSIRVPAACCGLVGLKPTRARNSLGPYLGEAVAGLVTEHAVTLTVRDCAALLDATSGPVPGDPYWPPPTAEPFRTEVGRNPGKLRVGFTLNSGNGAPLDPVCRAAVEQCARLCADLGHDVEEADPGIDGEATWAMFRTLLTANILVVLGSHPSKKRMPRADEVEHVTFNTAKLGESVSAADYVRATQAGHRLCRQMARYHEKYDLLLTPALAVPPARLGWLDMMLEDVHEYWRRIENFTPFSVWFNITGQPAIMLPMGFDNKGLPLSVQFAGRFGDEAILLRLSAQIEVARPWFDKRPGWLQ
jgi:amidase